MKRSEIAVNGLYAYARRPQLGGATKVEVVDTGDYGRLAKWHSTLNTNAYKAIRDRAGLTDDIFFDVGDENGTVAIREIRRDGTKADRVSIVASRFIQSSWLDHEVKVAEREAYERQLAAAREAAAAKASVDRAEFHEDVLRFAKVAESLGILGEVTDNGVDYFGRSVAAPGLADIVNASGGGRTRQAGLTHDAIVRLTAVLESVAP